MKKKLLISMRLSLGFCLFFFLATISVRTFFFPELLPDFMLQVKRILLSSFMEVDNDGCLPIKQGQHGVTEPQGGVAGCC